MSETSKAFHPEMIIAYLTLVLLAILVVYIFKNFWKQVTIVALHVLGGTAIGGIFGAVLVSIFYWLCYLLSLFTQIQNWSNEVLASNQRYYGCIFAIIGMLVGFCFGYDELKFKAIRDEKDSSSVSKNSKS